MDISKLNEIEKIAWGSEKDLLRLLNSLPVCIAYFDKEQRYQFNNKTYEEWFGLSIEKIRGEHIRDVLGENVYESIRKHIEKALSGQNVRYQTTVYDKNGKTRATEVTLIPRFDNNSDAEGCHVHMSDLSKLKESEKVVKLRGERFEVFMDNNPAFMYLKDRSGKHIYANFSLLKYFNTKLDEFIGTTAYNFLPEDVARKIEACDREVIENEVQLEMDDYSFVRDGKKRYFGEIKFPVILYSGEIGVGGIVIDITALKQKEEHLQKAYDEIKLLKDQLKKENIYLREEIRNKYHFRGIVNRSDVMQDVLKKAEQVAETDSTVLILGETGTGKELIARAIHSLSSRKQRAMVKVNCAALPSTLIESELFGREKGAYTGALSKQAGRFEVADGSTIFLDEIGELSQELQVKLLRVLQDGEFERLGSSKTMKIDVRVIAATNRDLEKAVQDGIFREDLYYRLKVFPIYISPLRKRSEDISPLVWSIVKELGMTMGKRLEDIKKSDMDALQRYHWPGNVRELRNVLEQAMIISTGKTLNIQIPKVSQERPLSHRKLEDVERDHILSVLEKIRWRVSGKNGAAEMLGLNESTLRARMKKLGIKRPS